MRSHEEHAEDIGAYLLGALPDAEAEAFERHAADCPLCRDELERLRPAAEALPRAVPQVAPPPALKAAIMADVRGEAAVPPRRTSWSALRLALPRLRPFPAWAGATAVLVLGALSGYGAARLADGDEARILSARVDPRGAQGASASLLVPEGDGAAVLSAQGLESGGLYVAWVQRGDEVIYESSFNARPDGSAKAAVESLAGVDRVMVTRERSAAVSAPGGPPVITVSTADL